MALLDSSGVKQPRDLHDDRLSFLEAVRTASLAAEIPSPPSWNMLNATFKILRDSRSLELAMASYHLLTDIDKCYPRVYPKNLGEIENPPCGFTDLVALNEAWSPFNVGLETAHRDKDGRTINTKDMVDPLSFVALVEDIKRSVTNVDYQLTIKTAGDMILFQYLVTFLESDFWPRQALYKETLKWALVRESLLNMLLLPLKLKFKDLIKACMLMISKQCHCHTKLQHLKNAGSVTAKMAQDYDFALAIAVAEQEKATCISVQKLLSLIVELDLVRKDADLNGVTSRLDGLRTPLLEIIVDELTYNKDLIAPFFLVFSEPRWKLELVLQYFSKYRPKSVRTRKSAESSTDTTFEGILSQFSTPTAARSIIKKVSPDVAQVLLAHAFQAYLSLQQADKLFANYSDKIGRITLSMTCKSLIAAFQNLRKVNQDLEVTSFEKEALFTAETILSLKS